MSRSAEEAKALEERILRMKLNSERLQRRHLEVEQDKLNAAQQNALVQVVSPPGNDWVIRNRSDEFEYVDNRSPSQPSPSEGFGEVRGRGWGRGRGRGEPRRSWASEHDDRADEPQPSPATRGRRSAPGFEQRPVRERSERWGAKTSPHAPGNAGNMVIGNWEDPDTESRRPPRRTNQNHNQNVIPSKVYSNTALEGPPPHKAKYRLAEGDGPPPDPSYSFLGDSMRDGNRLPDRRKESGRGMHRSDRGPDRSGRGPDRSDRGPGSGRMIGNQGNRRSPMPQQSYDEWRRERDAIDQRRINRQKTSDGHWSREWDSDKIVQNDASPPRYSSGDTWGNNSRRRYNNRFGDFLEDSFQKRPRTRSNQSQLNTSGSSDSRSPEKDVPPHDQRDFKGRQQRRQFSNENHFNKPSYDSPPHENRRSAAVTISKPLSPSARLEAARRATGPVHSTLRQYDTDVCTITLPSSSTANEAKVGSGAASSPTSSPDKNSRAMSPTLKVSVRTDETGKRTRVVEGVGCPDLTPELGMRDSKNNPEAPGVQKRRRQRMRKTRKKLVSQSSQSKDDESWEDLSSEEDVSVIADLPGPSKTSLETQLSSKSVVQDASSGPESLDPIPAANKEEELLWEEFHPAGFQNNMTLAMVTETAYKALLSKEEGEEKPHQSESDAAEKSDEAATKLDPILVVTQIVKAEVDCMSFTSVTTDSSLPEDINVPSKTEVKCVGELDAEELSGPVSILEIPTLKEEGSSDSPKSTNYNQCSEETNNTKEAVNFGSTNSECLNDVLEDGENDVGSERRRSNDGHTERSVSEDSCEGDVEKKSEVGSERSNDEHPERSVSEDSCKADVEKKSEVSLKRSNDEHPERSVSEDSCEGDVDKKSEVGSERSNDEYPERSVSEDSCKADVEKKSEVGSERSNVEHPERSVSEDSCEGDVKKSEVGSKRRSIDEHPERSVSEDSCKADVEKKSEGSSERSNDEHPERSVSEDSCEGDVRKSEVGSERRSNDEHPERSVSEDSCDGDVEKKSEVGSERSNDEHPELSVNEDGCEGDVDKKSEVGSEKSNNEHPERSVSKENCEEVKVDKKPEDLKEPVVDKEVVKPAESNSGCENQVVKSESVNGECLSKDSEAVSKAREKDFESVPNSVDASDSVKVDDKECQGASNSDDKSTSDNRKTKSENAECEGDSPTQGMSS